MIKRPIKILLSFLSLLILTISPFALRDSVDVFESIIVANDYRKIKLKIDSTSTFTPISVEGGNSSSLYYFYNFDKNLKIELSDQNNIITENKENRGVELNQAFRQMEEYGDSIWIWYHPSAKPSLAMEKSQNYPIKQMINILIEKIVIVVLALASIFWLIKNIKTENKS